MDCLGVGERGKGGVEKKMKGVGGCVTDGSLGMLLISCVKEGGRGSRVRTERINTGFMTA